MEGLGSSEESIGEFVECLDSHRERSKGIPGRENNVSKSRESKMIYFLFAKE